MRKQRKQFLRGTGDTGYICKVQMKILKCYNSNSLFYGSLLLCDVLSFVHSRASVESRNSHTNFNFTICRPVATRAPDTV